MFLKIISLISPSTSYGIGVCGLEMVSRLAFVLIGLVVWFACLLVSWSHGYACAPESWTRAGHLYREKYSENTRELLIWFS